MFFLLERIFLKSVEHSRKVALARIGKDGHNGLPFMGALAGKRKRRGKRRTGGNTHQKASAGRQEADQKSPVSSSRR